MKRRITFTVSFELPSRATAAMAREYVKSGLLTECGFRDPDDPMSDFNRDSVEIKRFDPGAR